MNNLNHRKAVCRLRFLNEDGRAAGNLEVKISQKNHRFLFGAGGFEAVELAGGILEGGSITNQRIDFLNEKLEKLFSLNNFATLPFYLGRYEPEEGKPDEARVKAGTLWFN